MKNDPKSSKTHIAFPLLIVAGIPLLGAFTLIGYFVWAMESDTVPPAALAQVRQGMTGAAIEDLLGAPAEIATNTTGSVNWIYKRSFRWQFVKITLKDDRVIRVLQE